MANEFPDKPNARAARGGPGIETSVLVEWSASGGGCRAHAGRAATALVDAGRTGAGVPAPCHDRDPRDGDGDRDRLGGGEARYLGRVK